MKKHLPKYITVRWEDHNSDSSWKTLKEIKEWATKQKPCITKGWITFEDQNTLVLSASFDGEESFGENICILKKNIVK